MTSPIPTGISKLSPMSTPPTMNGGNQQSQPQAGHPSNNGQSNPTNQNNLLGFNSMNGNQLDGCNNGLIEPPDSGTANGLANNHNANLHAGSNVGANCTSKWQAALANTNNLLNNNLINNNLINNNLLSNNLINNFNNFLPSQLHHHPVNHHLVNHQLANHHSMYSIDSKPQIF